MKNSTSRIALCLSALAVLLSGVSFVLLCLNFSHDKAPDGYEALQKFTMYIGTNDKDTEQLEMTLDEAEALTDEIALRYAEIFTSTIGSGKWLNADGTRTEETTLIYIFYGITDKQAEQIAGDVCLALNQSSVLIERSDSIATFYSIE
jgi:hypothetical protein